MTWLSFWRVHPISQSSIGFWVSSLLKVFSTIVWTGGQLLKEFCGFELKFMSDGSPCALWDNAAEIFLYSPSDLYLYTILSQRSTNTCVVFMAWFILCAFTVILGPQHTDMYVPFHNKSSQLNCSLMDFSCSTILRTMSGNRMHRSTYECHSKGVNPSVHAIL